MYTFVDEKEFTNMLIGTACTCYAIFWLFKHI